MNPQRFQPSRFGWKPPVIVDRFPPYIFIQYFLVFSNFPLAELDYVFPASLVFISTILCCFLWYLMHFLPLGHPRSNHSFYGTVMDSIASISREVCLYSYAIKYLIFNEFSCFVKTAQRRKERAEGGRSVQKYKIKKKQWEQRYLWARAC